ncbi:amino acid adenylation domain-containing protein [Stackebrandtia endophytica]|uniref:Amino acid adenylation domain-containing protein n=1 Tax=Stackebrandtia endophytica TaxID=1496996 RepID=A0A543ARW3_9ACTN|nr:non-ribosomal peptide synthetase [Stackebrandtia endophytica]TQL75318.1 amino acid adenylation domain-containing protein [Stackebrandtia endophytica]
MTDPDNSVADIVIEALGELVPDTRIDPATSLSRLGLGSLALTRLWMGLRQRLGVDVPVTELVKLPDVAALISRVADSGEPAQVEPDPTPSAPEPGAPLKPTDLQQAYQIGKTPELSPDPVGCHIYREFEVPDLDPDRFATAWHRAVGHHEALRLHITADGTQRIRDFDGTTAIETHDRADCDRQAADDWIAAVRDRLSHRRFTPGAWPLWDVVATRLPRGDGLVQLALDGSIIDGHGLSVLLDDLWSWYCDPDFASSRGGPSLSDCLARLTSGGPGEADRRYWIERLADLPPGPSAVATAAGDHRRVAFRSTVEAPQWARIEAAARRWSVSPTSLVLTLFTECLQRQRDREPHTLILTVSDRMRLPESAEDVVGPFTSSLVSPMPMTAGLSLAEAASAVYERLLADLRHSAMSGVRALRETRNGGVDLPVVFTSLIDTGRPARPGDFADSVTYRLSRTSGIALDHQMWVDDGRLHVHWDVAVERFEPGVVEELFAWFLNSLHWVDEADPVRHRLNELQQAYFVPRAVAEPSAWDGCQVYQSFELSEAVDVDRLQTAWHRLLSAYPMLTAIVDADGGIAVREGPPDRVDIPQIELATAEEATRYHAALRDRCAGRSFPLGRGPQWDLRTTRHPGGGTVHLTLDLTILDGRSIHLIARELLRLYREPEAAPLPSLSTPEPPAGDDERDCATEHWRARVAELPSGPILLDHDEPAPRVRRQRRLSGWRRLTSAAMTHRVRPDDVLAALFAAVIARHHAEPFSFPVVRWTEASQPHRPGEYTRLSWLRREPTTESVWRIAADIHRRITEDEGADAVDGLALMRRHVMRHRRATTFQLPVVYTGLLELTNQPLPSGITLGPWLTCTPDVALDCVTVVDGDEALLCWDAIEERFPAGRLDAMFDAYADAVADLCRSRDDGPAPSIEDTPTGFPAHLAFEEQARRRPEAVAVRWRGGEVGFGELNAWSNRIAWRLRDLGVTAGEPVAISVPRGPEMAAAVFGVLKAGGCYVPIDPGLPSGRAEVMMTESGASTVLVGARRDGWTPSAATTVVDIDGCAGREDDPDPVVGTDDPAYVIFTSGSTGKPKGVAVAHRTLGKLFDWCRRTHHFGPNDLGLCVTSLGFDLSVFDILGLLGVGAGLYIADEEQQHDPRLLLDILLSQPVTFWNSAPTTLHQVAPFLADAADKAGTDRLRLVYLSGDYTPLTLPDEVRAVFGNARVVSLGGATEATVWSNWFEIDTIDPSWRSIPYGLPIDHAEYHILDDHMRPCPTGVEGDLYIGGDCLAIGYHRQPELTRAAFLPDPFSSLPGARIYRTGDRAYRYPDGNICFVGRSDHQVKVRGFRVEPGEIEHRLRQHPAVKDAVVTVEGDADRKLVGHLLPTGIDRPTTGRLRAFVAETLPDYMVPNLVRFHDVFPATPNGKLDRDALISTEEPPAEPEAVAVVDDVVAEIAGIFAELLETPEVKPDDDLWDLGATSFTMVRASAAIQQRHGRRIPVSVLLAQPTVAGIAADLGVAPAVPKSIEPDRESAEPPVGVDFFSATERAAFKAARHDLRVAGADESIVHLGAVPADVAERAARASRREFPRQPVELSELAALLAGAAEHVDSQGPPRRYPSAGDTYAVRIYLRVRSGGVTGLDGGLYYYHPLDHALHRVSRRDVIDPGLHFGYNRPLAGQAAFELYLFGRANAITPLYGDDAQRFLALEAGYLGQVLMQAQTDTAIGLCPIGSVNIEAIRTECGLDAGDPFLQAFVAGGIDRAGDEAPTGAAVCGVAGRFPDADNPRRLWRNLSSGVRSLRPVSDARRAQVGGDHPGGFLSDVDTFDPLLFHISPMEAARLDPQVRLLLTVVWECLEDAAHTAAELNGDGRVGVFLGTMWQDHRLVAAQSDAGEEIAAMSSTGSQAANRISHFFGFTGPSIAVDTSCASSLTALHLAVESIRDGECDAAVVAAANLFLHPHHLRELVDSGLLAERLPEGAFDPDVVGWVPGEGVAAILLRRFDSTVDSRVDAVIEATQVGHRGGRGRYGTPDAEQLGDGLRRLLSDAHLAPEYVDYIECAAAGSAVADAAEVEAITSVFGATSPPLGSVKPNIGHLEAAAGLAQLIKVIAQLGHRRFAPTIASSRSHPMIEGVTDRVVTESTDWTDRPDGRPRRALVNAIGATGSHAHVIVREAPRIEAPAAPATAPVHVVLSAATESELADLAGSWHDHLSTLDMPPSPSEVAYTSQLGRTALEHRLAIACGDHGELLTGLATVSRGGTGPSIHHGGIGASSGSSPVDRWLSGESVDWRQAWPQPRPRRIELPTYPFTTTTRRDDRIVDTNRPSEAPDRLASLLTRLYSEVSGIAVERLRPEVPLEHYGLTSLLISRLTARLESEIGRISPTVFYEHPTLGRVAAALATTARIEPGPVIEPDPEPEPAGGEAVAIIGVAGRYPEADDVDQFWRNLAAGRDSVTGRPPPGRLGGTDRRMPGGYLAEVDTFDPLFFGITPHDAALMDPQERLFLQTGWHALEDAGYSRHRLSAVTGNAVGVYAASMYNEYPFHGLDCGHSHREQPPVATGSAIAGIANRVSYFLDCHGPSLTVDTMCSGSLTAIHLAVTGLRGGECSMALAGGVNLSLHPNKYVQLEQRAMLAPGGRCRAFSVDADGFVPGEGVGVVVLKPLSRALADGDRIHAVIEGSAINHGGKTNGYSVPSPAAQARLVAEAMRDAAVGPADIGYIEAHGTGTALGDPVEVSGLDQAFADALPPTAARPLGTVKTNIGHLEAAAGIAGLTKVIMQFRHDTVAPSLHAEDLNPAVDWSATPFRVQRTAAPWPAVPKRAGISSFGAGGSGGHLIVAAPPPPASVVGTATDKGGEELILLSARTSSALLQQCQRLRARLIEHPGVELSDVAYTLQVGREQLRHRLAIVAADVAELCEALERPGEPWPTGVVTADDLHRPMVTPQPSADPRQLARRWMEGERFDFTAWHRPGRRRVVNLPGYPFERMRCWVDSTITRQQTPTKPAPAPLLTRRWQPIETAWQRPPDPASVLCLIRPDQRDLAGAVARELGTPTLILTDGETAEDDRVFSGWLDLTALPGPLASDDENRGWRDRLATLRDALGTGRLTRVMQVTSGLLDMPGTPPRLAGAPLAGFVKNLAAHHDGLQSTVLDIDATDHPIDRLAREVVAEWRAGHPAGEICRRGGDRFAPQLVATEAPPTVERLDPAVCHLVTGGTGRLGLLAAGRLVDRGATRLAILGHRRLPPRSEWDRADLPAPQREIVAAIRGWQRRGCEVLADTGDLADRVTLDRFLDRVRRELGPIGGLIHCAGSRPEQDDASFPGRVESMFAAKVEGLDLLTELTAEDPLRYVVLYSSVSASIPALAVGLPGYAAANSYLDHFASVRQRRGDHRFRSIAWPIWRRTDPQSTAACDRVGMGTLTDEAGLTILDTAIVGPARNLLVWPATAAAPVRDLGVNPTPTPTADDEPVRRIVADCLGIAVDDLDPTAEFADLGVESVMMAELVRRLENRYGRPIDPTSLLDHPTTAKLSRHLADAPPAPSEVERPSPTPSTGDDRVAVIGMACRFPGADDVAEFWRLLNDGDCAVSAVPTSRWDVHRWYDPAGAPGTSVSARGGFVTGIEEFDAGYFDMSDEAAANTDPAVRLALENAAMCLADAGYTEESVRGGQVGVFMGARMSGYRDRVDVTATPGLGGDQNFIAAALSHHFDLRGPNLVVDSACSSALVSVAMARRSLLSGETDLAFAGGVEVLLDERPYLSFTAAKALSPRGRCASFDAEADGFVPGEGCGVVLLKRLSDAIRDGDRIQAIIEAVAVGNDGRTMGLTTPNPQAQAAVIRRALSESGLTADQIGMIEAHGTGTMIGDPIELRALTQVFGEQTAATGYCAIGSVKSNIGHLLSAAGIAGLIKVVLSLGNGRRPATLFCERPNPRFDFASSPFFPNRTTAGWDGLRRAAGVSAFGLGGTNAHLIATGPDPDWGPGRTALPPPGFTRRRLWLERPEPSSDAPQVSEPVVASVLDLRFVSAG